MTEQGTKAKIYVTKDMMVGEAVEKYPEAGPIMQGYGLHCVGCHVSPFETIEQGVMGHGMSEDVLHEMLSDVNAQLAKLEGEGKLYAQMKESALKTAHETGQDAVILTQRAADKIKFLAEKDNKQGHGLYIAAIPGGCSGFQYDLRFMEKPTENEQVLELFGVKLFLDKGSLQMFKGSTIDYVETLQESGFDIQNPNASTGCGCGKSFA